VKGAQHNRKRCGVMNVRTFLGLGAVALTSVAALTAVASATMPGKNGKIVFRVALGHPARLEIVNADGTGERRLTRTKGVNDSHPDWSPDGSTIAFQRCVVKGTAPCVIIKVRAGGTGLERLGPGNDDRAMPTWAPNGKLIAFSRAWGPVQSDWIKFNELFVMNASGKGLSQITRFNASRPFSTFVGGSSWSPDGKQLVFEMGTSPRGEPANALALFVVNADGSDLRQLTPWSLNAGERPDWSPDGELILFKAPAKGQHGNLYTINPDGSGLRQLTRYPPPRAVYSGAFSPDGEWITFSRFPGPGIFVMRVDGTGVRQITRGGWHSEPDWGPAR
jgi:TolB protein